MRFVADVSPAPPFLAELLPRRVLVRAAILGLFIGVHLLDGAYTYLSVGVLDEAAEQPPLLAWSTTIFGVGATLATAKGLAVTAGTVLLSRLLRDDLFSQ